MRYLTRDCPAFRRVVLIESGPRAVLEAAIPRLRGVFGQDVEFDLVTCFPGVPITLERRHSVWRTQNYNSSSSRAKLASDLKQEGASVVALICSGDSIMTRWKWWLAWKLPAKVLLINENADCFWLDAGNLGAIRRFTLSRLGLSGGFAAHTVARILRLPFLFGYLLLYATVVHARRAWRTRFRSP